MSVVVSAWATVGRRDRPQTMPAARRTEEERRFIDIIPEVNCRSYGTGSVQHAVPVVNSGHLLLSVKLARSITAIRKNILKKTRGRYFRDWWPPRWPASSGMMCLQADGFGNAVEARMPWGFWCRVGTFSVLLRQPELHSESYGWDERSGVIAEAGSWELGGTHQGRQLSRRARD